MDDGSLIQVIDIDKNKPFAIALLIMQIKSSFMIQMEIEQKVESGYLDNELNIG